MPATLQLALLIAILLPAGKIVASICTRFGIPAILGELMVGVVAGPGCIDMLHLRLFSGTPAADAFLLLAQIGGFVLMFIAGLETDIDRMREASVYRVSGCVLGRDLAVLSGGRRGTSAWSSLEHRLFSGWSADGHQRFHFGAHADGCRQDDFARSIGNSWRGGHRRCHGPVCARLSRGLLQQYRRARIRCRPHAFQLAAKSSSLGGPASARCADDAYRHLRQQLLRSCYSAAQRWVDPLMRLFRKLDVNEAVTSCVLALVLLFAVSAEWLGSVAGITGAYLLGYVFAGAKLKTLIERTFYAIGHGLLIPLFFVSIGLSSNFRALGGHWLLLIVIFTVAVISKLIGCGMAALGMGMGRVRSFRVGCGMISRGEVGLIVTAMGASTGIFQQPEVAVMVTVVLLTTLITPLIMRGAFLIKCPEDQKEGEDSSENSAHFSAVSESQAEA